VRLPVAAGANTRDAAQLEPAASVAPQVFDAIEKSAELEPEKVKPLMVIPVAEVLTTVTVCAALLPPTGMDAKLSAADDSETVRGKAAPVPESETDSGELLAEFVSCSVAERAPVAPGVNATDTEQLAALVKVAAQVLAAMEKSVALEPASVKVPKVTSPEITLRVRVCEAAVVPTIEDPKLRAAGATVSAGAIPDPESAIACGELPAVFVRFSVAERVPVDDALNVTETVQLAALLMVAIQVFPATEKSAAFVPAIVAAPKVTRPEATLSVTLCEALAAPTIEVP
jgi:hypothetical protein